MANYKLYLTRAVISTKKGQRTYCAPGDQYEAANKADYERLIDRGAGVPMEEYAAAHRVRGDDSADSGGDGKKDKGEKKPGDDKGGAAEKSADALGAPESPAA